MLVVDASGRGSQSPKWLKDWGYGQPDTISVKVDVGYATRVFERRPGDFFGSMGGVISGTPPEETRLAAVLAAEGNRWVVTLAGTLGDHAPTEEKAWAKFAASLPVPIVYELVSSARPLTDILTYRFASNVEGTRPPGFHLVNRYLERVHAAASQDPVVCRKFFDVLNLLAPPTSLMTPRVAWRVLGRPAPRGQGSPWGVMREGASVAATGADMRAEI